MNKKSPAYVLSFMAAICLVFGTGIAVVNYATQGLLAKNAAMHRNRVLCRAFQLDVAGASAEAYQNAVDASLRTNDFGGRLVYICTAPGKESVGFVAGGMGFWDRIECVVVVSPDLQTILNVRFLDQKETPGLGARIEEPGFTDQFKGLELAWNDPQGQRILVGANPAPNAPNEVDAITGATQTSMALMRFLNEELDRFRAAYSAAANTLNADL
ncbi:MAG: FMN-binding protein [Opitutae bacterium]|nr:FMN-binding protein [Opitutae bacterium]